jgi:ribonuclease BN (tRNA processing enzyme)
MRLRVLGCSGGIGVGLRTTSMLIDHDILIDAGSGVGELSLGEMARIKHIFLTHSHLDHIGFIPLLLDSIFDHIEEPIMVHGLPETIQALRMHIFNWVVWPDFSKLPDEEHPVVRFAEMRPGRPFVSGERTLEMLRVNHAVPGVGYRIECPGGVIAFSGDTTTNDEFWEALNRRPRLDILIVEAAFSNRDEEISRMSRHFCANLLAADMVKLRHTPEVYITHNKPGEEAVIIAECQAAMPERNVKPLLPNHVFEL